MGINSHNKDQQRGVYTALVTPFASGKVCYKSFEKLIEQQLAANVAGIIVLGSTGESPTVMENEREEIIQFVVKQVKERIPVYVGTGHNSTQQSVLWTQKADKLGAHGFLVVTPYYNKPNQEGLFRHYSSIAECTDKPIILYSVPGRTGIEISVPVIGRLKGKYPHVVGIKESSGNCDRVSEMQSALGDSIKILAGDDSYTLPFMALGSSGVVSVASNLAPEVMHTLYQLMDAKKWEEAKQLHLRYYGLFKALFVETNPSPVKFALWKCGIISSPETRLPLCPITEDSQVLIKRTLHEIGML